MKPFFTTCYFLFFGLIPVWSQQAQFLDVSSEAGINNPGTNYGIAIVDYDNDGDEDIYVTVQDEGVGNKLYQNDGMGHFVDVAPDLGIANEGIGLASVWGDIDNDGDKDLYVGNRYGPDYLYRNDVDTFVDVSFLSGIYNPERPRSVNMADVDNDGDLDIYVSNLLSENILFRNMGDNLFLNATNTSGALDPNISMGSIFFDYDNDNDQDLYLTHDAGQTFIFYENDGTGAFSNVASLIGTDLETQGMGVDFADFNLDGHFDIYVSNLYPNSLLLNNGDGTYTDISESAGIEDWGMGWSVVCFDYDNDGYQDIYIANESNIPPMRNNILYRNNGDNTFSDVSAGTVIGSPNASTGAAYGDFNNDGRLDMVIANKYQIGNQIFLNEDDSDNNWLRLKTVGTISNRDGVGARATLYVDDKVYMDEVTLGSGYASQNSLILHFGLGQADEVDLLTVRWPSGIIDSLENVSPNQLLTIIENEPPVTTSISEWDGLELSFMNPSPRTIRMDYQVQSQIKGLEYVVYNPAGELLHQEQVMGDSGRLEWEAPIPGLYIFHFNHKGKTLTRKILVE